MVKEESFDEDENSGIGFETQTDLEPDAFMETLHQVDFEDALQHQGDALQYQVTMGIWALLSPDVFSHLLRIT